MSMEAAEQAHTLTISREFKHSKKEVYEAWTNRDALIAWFAPAQDVITIVHSQDLVIGGKYKIEMQEPNGNCHVIHGHYVSLEPYDSIAFTWQWEADKHIEESLVTITLEEQAGQTHMTLIHSKLKSDQSIERHANGWALCLNNLENHFSRTQGKQ